MTDNGGKHYPIGVAMIARNATKLMPLALDPILEYVDDVAIVLGGISDDGTDEMARKYATLPVEWFNGKLAHDGSLMHFGDARQQSFNILMEVGHTHAFVVDTDDQWQGLENLQGILGHMVENGFPMTFFPYHYAGGMFMQPRLYRMNSGHWEGPCHNWWKMDGEPRVALQSKDLSIVQERPPGHGKRRRDQNIHISTEWMKENGDDPRLLLHLARDLQANDDFEQAFDVLERYFPAYEADERNDPEELYNAHHSRAALLLTQEKFAESMFSALRALTIRPHGQSWTLASDAAGWLGKHSQNPAPMLKLSEFCAQMSIDTGKPRGNLHWHSEKLAGALPLYLKARALAGLGEFRRARGMLDLALEIDPEHEDMTIFRNEISRKLGDLS